MWKIADTVRCAHSPAPRPGYGAPGAYPPAYGYAAPAPYYGYPYPYYGYGYGYPYFGGVYLGIGPRFYGGGYYRGFRR